jgi:HPt (histidine-containing phosphotransfer) domain-containing protein
MPFLPTTHRRLAHAAQDDVAAQGGPWGGVLDAAALERLHELDPGGHAGLVTRVVNTFITSLDKLLAQWATARSASDLTALRHVAHTLKSSSASVGALALSTVCADVERRIRDGVHDGLEPQLDALAAEAQRVREALRAARGAA